MPRQKKDYVVLYAKMDADVMARLSAYCDDVGQTKTLALERIVDAFLREYESGKRPAGMFKSEAVNEAK